ncbi:MAG: cell division protein FtsI [Gemmatimonadota bacterium]|jgi:cell division protein FtsI (penicillin-binding protein 3)
MPGPGAASPAPLLRPGRRGAILAGLLVATVGVIARAAQLQLLEHEQWSQVARRQHVREREVRPARGAIEDAAGGVLAQSRDLVRLSIDPRALRPGLGRPRGADDTVPDYRTRVRDGLGALSVPDAVMRRAMDTLQRPLQLPGQFLPSDVERFVGIPGIRRLGVVQRVSTAPASLRGVLGAVDGEGTGTSGLEMELDALLRGTEGLDTLVLAGDDGVVTSPEFRRAVARPGLTVRLTINSALQEIAEEALAEAMRRTGAAGGDVVVLDPDDGAILVLAGLRQGAAMRSGTPVSEAYQPGSVMKPFLVARLMDAGRTRPAEVVNTENGRWAMPGRRQPLTDEHKAPQMTVADIIRFSSNIGIAKLAQRLSSSEEYEVLRDFGFGTYTGVPHPAESPGLLPRPPYTGVLATQLAIGYEVQATPLQLAAAYVAIANGGELLQPVLVRALFDADGTSVFTQGRTVLRRVMRPATAQALRGMLESVVDSGTSQAAALATFRVAGKSGTARRLVNGQYSRTEFDATFAGLFPADDPQLVLVARLVGPKGTYYGGTVAGALVNDLLQRALASRAAGLDWQQLAAAVRLVEPPIARGAPGGDTEVAGTSAGDRAPGAGVLNANDGGAMDGQTAGVVPPHEPAVQAARIVVRLPLQPGGTAFPLAGAPAESTPVPPVGGLDARQATRVLARAGFLVRVERGGAVRTRPTAGTLLPPGTRITLEVPR